MAQGPCKKQSPGPSRGHEETALIFPETLVGKHPVTPLPSSQEDGPFCHAHSMLWAGEPQQRLGRVWLVTLPKDSPGNVTSKPGLCSP